LNQKKQLDEDLQKIRERNHEDSNEIERLNLENDSKGKESVQMTAMIRSLEYDISKSLGKIDDLQRVIDQKSQDISVKESQLVEVEQDAVKLKS
jgi:hypothetical protein